MTLYLSTVNIFQPFFCFFQKNSQKTTIEVEFSKGMQESTASVLYMQPYPSISR